MSIKKIAEITGYSPSTVSRILNKPDYKCSSEEMREAILKAARDEGYIPNESARNLKIGKNPAPKIHYINIIVTRNESAILDPFFNELLHAVEIEMRKNTCILSKVWECPYFSDIEKCITSDAEKIIEDMFGNEGDRKCDGIIIIGVCSPQIVKMLNARCRNIVAISRHSTDYIVDEIVCSGERLASIAVKYLIDLGHRSIGYVGGTHNHSRFDGYTRTLFEHKISIEPDFIYETELSVEGGYRIMDEVLHKDNIPTAFYCSNDIVAIGMLKCLKKYKKRIYFPSIISCDDIEAAQYTSPMLTTVKIPKDEMASFAINILLDRINGGHRSVLRVELDGSLIIRDSCTDVNNSMICDYII